MDDEPILQRAAELGRVFFTHDDDFLAIADRWLAAKRPFSGIVYVHQYRLTVRQIIVELEMIAKVADPTDMQESRGVPAPVAEQAPLLLRLDHAIGFLFGFLFQQLQEVDLFAL